MHGDCAALRICDAREAAARNASRESRALRRARCRAPADARAPAARRARSGKSGVQRSAVATLQILEQIGIGDADVGLLVIDAIEAITLEQR